MNRRTFAASSLTASIFPGTVAKAQQTATPQAQPPQEQDPVDPRTRGLAAALALISPTALLEALEVSEVTDPGLIEANGGEAPISVPWADYGDTDLYSSLGGVGITSGNTSLSDPDTEMLGAYIVYESTEIAYHEFIRKIGDLYDNPSMTMSVAGTNVWIVESDEFRIGAWRISNVMMMALLSDHEGLVIKGIIGHLADVAASIEPTSSRN